MIPYAQLTRRGQIRRLRQVAGAALPLFGTEPMSVTLLNHAYHTTFTVIGHDHRRYVLHILRPEADDLPEAQRRVRVESELWWLDRARSELDLTVPVPVRTPGGEGVVGVTVERIDRPRLCTLFHWVDGRFRRNHLSAGNLEAVGRLTARLHGHSERLRVPAWFDRPTVDRADPEIEEEVARLFSDHVSTEAAEVIRAALQRTRCAQEELGKDPTTFGVIHADIHQWNYMFRGGEVVLIDFGDCGWGHYLYDLAVTLCVLEGFPNSAQLRRALLAGYRRVRHLPATHEALIDTYIMLRTVQDLAWDVQAREDPVYRQQAAQVGDGVAALAKRLGDGG